MKPSLHNTRIWRWCWLFYEEPKEARNPLSQQVGSPIFMNRATRSDPLAFLSKWDGIRRRRWCVYLLPFESYFQLVLVYSFTSPGLYYLPFNVFDFLSICVYIYIYIYICYKTWYYPIVYEWCWILNCNVFTVFYFVVELVPSLI